MSVNRSDPLGYDVWIGPTATGVDMAADGRACSGVELVANALRARSMADSLPMTGAPGGRIAFGVDMRAKVGAPVTADTAAAWSQELAVVYGRDPRIAPETVSVRVSGSRSGSQYAFVISVNARTTTAQPIAMILGVSALTVDVLAAQGA